MKISKHLKYMKELGMVVNERIKNRVYYSIPKKISVELKRHLRCLHDSIQEYPVFVRDLENLEKKEAKMT